MQNEDRARILHMIDATDTVAQFIGGRSREELDGDRMLLFALVHAIEILGEAANKISPETRAAAPQIPWGAIVAMRNRLIHGYFDIDNSIVWKTATVEIPTLAPLLRTLAGTIQIGVAPVKTRATTEDILDAVRESRERG